MTGKVLKNRYCILEQIGKGGNATVYLARDLELGVLRAVKELPVSGKREARFLASLEHPSIPQMVDYDEDSRSCYIVMEYIKGETLGELFRKEKVFSVRELADFGIALSQVLGYLHSRKPPVFFGDLKPDNLMLSESGKLYLIDLGSAVAGYEKVYHTCMGTEGFAAPEQYEGRINAASDVFSLGKTLTVLWGKGRASQFLAFPELAWILLRCCLPEEKLRYQKMDVLEKKFQRIQKGGAIRGFLVIGVVLLMILSIGLFLFGGKVSHKENKKEPDFYDRLTEVTKIYHLDIKGELSSEERIRQCEEAEKILQSLLKQYRGQKEYRQIMRQLAFNREYAEDEVGAALYYEQLLQYDGGYRDAYGDYGMFLLQREQEEGCLKLWKKYRQREKESGLEEGKSWNVTLWEAEMVRITREKKKQREVANEKKKQKKMEKREHK